MSIVNEINKSITIYETKLNALVDRLYREKASPARVEREIQKFTKSYPFASGAEAGFKKETKSIRKRAERAADKKYKWIKKHTVRPDSMIRVQKLYTQTSSDFAKIQGKINKSVLREAMYGIRADLPRSEVAENISRKLKMPKYQAQTIANTSTAGYDRLCNGIYAAEAGVNLFEYSGQRPQRLFCLDIFGKEYTLEEISRMDNEQGLDVFEFGGGWNCVHFWDSVIRGAANASAEQIEKNLNYFNRAA